MLKPKVSVIVPIYKVEKFIERCACSLFEQTLNEIEYIFVDDCSPDRSIPILENILSQYPNRKPWVKIIHHERNRGLTSSRNTGISIASGEFLAHCDSDDWIEPTMYEEMYECAKKNDSDAVYCDINMIFRDGNSIYKAAVYSTCKTQFLRNYIASAWTSLCNTLIKIDIYRNFNLFSPEHLCYCEDFWLSVRLFYYADSVSYIGKAFYNYNRVNEVSITHSLNRKTEQEERRAYKETIDFFNKEGVGEDYKKEMSWRILKSTHDSIYHKRLDEFLSIYPEAHSFIWSCPYINIKTKLLLWMLTHKMKPLAILIIKLRDLIRQ